MTKMRVLNCSLISSLILLGKCCLDLTFCAVDDDTEVKDRGRQISEVIVTN